MKQLKMFIFTLMFVLATGIAMADNSVCQGNELWVYSDNPDNAVLNVIDCGTDETADLFCNGDEVWQNGFFRGCYNDTCYEDTGSWPVEECPVDGCYDDEYRNYGCSNAECTYTIVTSEDVDHDGIDDICDDCIDKNKNGICLGEDACDDCIGNDLDSPFLNILDCEVKVDGRYVEPDKTIYKVFERGEDINIDLELVAIEDAEDVQIQALILGYRHGNDERNWISDFTPTFDIKKNRAYNKDLTLKIPPDIETGELKLRIIISDRTHTTWVHDYNLDVDAERHSVVISDILLDPNDEIRGGRSLFAELRVKNYGEDYEKDMKVEIGIPTLDVKVYSYMDWLDNGDAENSEEMRLDIPECPKEGYYTLVATAYYDDGYEETTKEDEIYIYPASSCNDARNDARYTDSSSRYYNDSSVDHTASDRYADDKSPVDNGDDSKYVSSSSRFDDHSIVSVSGSQSNIKGSDGAVYPVMITNKGITQKTYTISVKGMDSWGNYRIEPRTVVVVPAGKTEVPYVYVTAKPNADSGEKVFAIEVAAGDDVNTVTVTADVTAVESDNDSDNATSSVTGNVIAGLGSGDVKSTLQIALLGMVVLLIIIGLIVGVGKLKDM